MSEKQTIGILYIATGPYIAFWEEFYQSFEAHFLLDCERHYFIFTDADQVYGATSNQNIHIHAMQNLPWPLVTLFRFRTFLSIEDELKKMDYLVFSNANMKCVADITREEFLPREERGEELFAAIHPGYAGGKAIFAPYERSRKSKAYVPYNCGKKYVIGAMNGGKTVAFLEMCHALSTAVDEDLKKNVIASWHDESHLNCYVSANPNRVRLLSESYCYPCGMDVEYEERIVAVSKQAKFDVKTFKGMYEKKRTLGTRICSVCNGIRIYVKAVGGWIIDTIFRKKIH